MKNTHILPNTEVPIELRKEVYREALEYYEKGKFNKYLGKGDSKKKSLGLCLLLPCVLWGLKTYLDASPIGQDWLLKDIRVMFPELNNFLTKNRFDSITDEKRINFLKSVI